MNWLVRVVGVVGVCWCVVVMGFQSETADFSGKWKLDFQKSRDLPESFRNVDSYVLDISQAGDSMTVNTTVRGDGQTISFPTTTYKFNGEEVVREDTLRGSKRWIKASWTTTGQKLIVTSRVEQRRQDGANQKYTETDVWQYGMKHSLLIISTRTYDGSDSTQSERRVYTRMQ